MTAAGTMFRRISWIIALLGAGAVVAGVLVATREPPARAAESVQLHAVSVVNVQSLPVVPRAVGYGAAQPGRVWNATAEVPGRVVFRHPELESGALIPEGTELLRLDPTDHELAVAQLQAGIRAREAGLEELAARETSTRQALEIEQQRLALAETELERARALAERGSVSASQVDAERQRVLQARQSVQQLRTTLATLPAERERLSAELARDRAQLQQARRDVQRTVIRAPYDVRISHAVVEAGDFASRGQRLLTADGIERAEVVAQMPISEFRNVLQGIVEGPPRPNAIPDLGRLSARLTLVSAVGDVHWDARVTRVAEGIDPRTRTVGVVATVEAPYTGASPPERPPLVKDMYLRVEVRGTAQPDSVVIPRASLHGRQVYVAQADDTLAIRTVEVAYKQQDFAVVASGLEAGERVLVSDLVPAVSGMQLMPQRDRAAERHVARQATGGAQ